MGDHERYAKRTLFNTIPECNEVDDTLEKLASGNVRLDCVENMLTREEPSLKHAN